MKLRCQALWAEMQQWYRATGVKDTLQNLSLTMLQQRGKQPKLRANAAQVRALVPFACVLAQRLLVADRSQKVLAMLTAARLLYDCYRSLSSQTPKRAELLDHSSRRLALQLVALAGVPECLAVQAEGAPHAGVGPGARGPLEVLGVPGRGLGRDRGEAEPKEGWHVPPQGHQPHLAVQVPYEIPLPAHPLNHMRKMHLRHRCSRLMSPRPPSLIGHASV